MVATPRKSAEHVGRAFGEYLKRALTQSVALREPKDVAWFIASYARDALQRVEEAGDLPALANVRASLEEALGVKFEAAKGDHFFRSTLVQTLFYGVFSAWVLWAREMPRSSPKFDWRTAIWHLTVPFIRELFQQLASPKHLQPLGLVEVLDWTAATLNYRACAAAALSYEQLGLSRDAARERKAAKTKKTGRADPRHPAVKRRDRTMGGKGPRA